MLVDSHCHLDGPAFEADRAAVIERARAAGVSFMLAIGTGDGPPDLEAAVRIAERYPDVGATVGVHPHHAARFDDSAARDLDSLCRHPEVLAVGEIGLDYHYPRPLPDVQRQVFLRQMEIAAAHGKPVTIHTRDAWDDTLDLLSTHWAGNGIGRHIPFSEG